MRVWRTVGGGETDLMMDAFGPRRWMTLIQASAPHYGPSPFYIRISKHRVAYFLLSRWLERAKFGGCRRGPETYRLERSPSAVAMPSEA